MLIGLNRLQLNQDITASLPKGEEFKELNQFLQSSQLNNQIAFALETQKVDADSLEFIAQEFIDSLQLIANDFLPEINYYSAIDEHTFYDYYSKNLPLFLNDEQFDSLIAKTNSENIQKSLEANYKKLVSPEGTFVQHYLINDPLSLTPIVLNQIKNTSNAEYVVENGLTFSKDKKRLIIFSEVLNTLTLNPKLQSQSAEKLANFQNRWNTKHKMHKMTYFSPFLIAVANADQIKIDTTLTLSIFIVFTLLLLFFFYKKWSTPFYFLLPAIFGLLFSLGIIAWYKGSISAISVAAGAVVLGIILDYAFHFFTHFKQTQSLEKTINDISIPLFTGSFTTIVAFLALQFTNSVILQDFGLFAALSLLGAAAFTIFILPSILNAFHFRISDIQTPLEKSFDYQLPFKIKSSYAFIFILILTIFFAFQSKHLIFDADLENLGYHPLELKKAEETIFNLNPASEKKIFLFAKAKTYEEAVEKNEKLYQNLKSLKGIKQLNSIAQFTIPKTIQKQRIEKWNTFLSENKSQIINDIDNSASSNGFTEDAFENFKNNFKFYEQIDIKAEEDFLKTIQVNKLIDKKPNETVIVTTIVVDKKNKADLLARLNTIDGIDVLDRSNIVSQLLEVVRKDFNLILFISSTIVFLTLLLVYGRIELALVVFIPMLVSWIWIVGMAALLHIPFNFVNIIITSFIFGLGDDFSIFISDGHLSQYKYGKNHLKTYKVAILLSAITTIIGTGVLMFAKHPAVNSIGFISVLGMISILVIAMVLQPILYKWLIFNRVKKGRSPWTLSSWLLSFFAYTYFLFGCIVASIIATLFLIIPLKKKVRRKGMATILHYFGASLIYVMFNVTKKFEDKHLLDLSKPSILVANHSSVLDILLTLTISPKILLVTNNWVYNSPFFGYLVRTAGFVLNSDIEDEIESIREKINDGYSIMIFPEGTRSKTGEIARFKKGAFFLAEKLQLDITPVIIHGAYYTMSKSDFQLKNSWLNVKFLPRIKFNDTSFGSDYSTRTKSILQYFREQHEIYRLAKEDEQFIQEPLNYLYIYKGPILEWYFKIKYQLEKKNFVYYDAKIIENFGVKNDLEILDLGCGYGYLSYYLWFRNKNRKIVAYDYDQDKIAVAQNIAIRTDALQFETKDLRTFSLNANFDVIFIMDVLHYFGEKHQTKVIEECIQHLNEGGLLFIRDGISNLTARHKNTLWTEFFSSKIGFNKKEEAFHFFNKEFIEQLAEKHHCSLAYQEHSDKTSNVLFILTKVKA